MVKLSVNRSVDVVKYIVTPWSWR